MHRFSLLSGLLAAPLLGCVEEASPIDGCASMCESGRARWESCLADWGVGWEAAGFESADDWQGSCETWVWEQELLARDADAPPSTVEDACADRAALYETGECSGLP
jgi:hypothetical protein